MTALRVLHDAGGVHLDLQPANILEDLEGRAGQSGSMWHSILHFIRHIRSDILFGILSGTSGISSDILSWRLGSWPGRLKLIDFGCAMSSGTDVPNFRGSPLTAARAMHQSPGCKALPDFRGFLSDF